MPPEMDLGLFRQPGDKGGGSWGIGDYDESETLGWGDPAAKVVASADQDAETHTILAMDGDVGVAYPGSTHGQVDFLNYGYYAFDQATAAADSSRNLADDAFVQGPHYGYRRFPEVFPVGVIMGVWANVRCPDADTISARWYIDGAAVGSTATFSNDYHSVARLPDFNYTLEDWLQGKSLTLRLWGGLVHIGRLVLLPRPEVTNAEDYLDGAATYATVVSEPAGDNPSGGSIVKVNLPDGISAAAATKVLRYDPPPVVDERFYLLYVLKNQAIYANNATWGDWSMDSGKPGYASKPQPTPAPWTSVWRNGSNDAPFVHANNLFHTYSLSRGSSNNAVPGLHHYAQEDDEGASGEAGGHIFPTGDYMEVRADNEGITAYTTLVDYVMHYDQVIFGRRIERMDGIAYPDPGDPVTASFDFFWFYTGPIEQGGDPDEDRSDLLVSVDGLVFDGTGNLIFDEIGISNPWTVDISLLSGAGPFLAIVRGNLDDGSVAFVGWVFTMVSGAVSMNKRLPSRAGISVAA